MPLMLEGKPVALEIEQRLRDELAEVDHAPGPPATAAAVLVGDDESSHAYFRSILRTFKRVGIDVVPREIEATISEDKLERILGELNQDPDIDGVIVFQPLPDHLDRELPANILSADKDIDGITYANAGRLSLAVPHLVPSTPMGGIEILRHYQMPIEGQHAVVIGRSPIVGQPMALLLLAENATVTICHSRTRDLASITREADIVVLAAGKPGVLTGDMIRPGTTVIDFGVNFVDGSMTGDADPSVMDVAGAITPVPGGTGVVTQRVLAANTVRAARIQRRLPQRA
ncbi:MAG: bifunctional 5,10-methylenetetrahydrofolate dehydrogenase/5,10-methenyltetrahydrofolate cyclohydrolase [Sphaerobacteraceae bacterium]|nr:MAG: bifunctional 5,10-methylenetetrahydrofolate dehydrogenase/5,10-methenyltetrahydrofolate cyclohydrolase [Sphaerobacteraceae bacterium]